MGFEGLPFSIGWELTLSCNLRCRHCASSAGRARRQELTTNEALSLCDQFPELLVQEVAFTGGEPLLRPDWWLIAGKLGKMGIAVTMVTNGVCLTENTLAQLKDVGITSLGVSVDGVTAVHDWVRGRDGSLAQALDAMERAIAAGLKITAFTTVNGLNVDQLDELYALLVSRGISQWQMGPIFRFGRTRDDDELLLSEEGYVRLGRFYDRVGNGCNGNGFKLFPSDSLGYFSQSDEKYPPWKGCSAGISLCSIMSDGRVKGCLSLPDDLVEGSVREKDLWDIWFAPDAFSYTRGFTPDSLGPNCARCDHGEQCRGGCSAMSYSHTYSFHNDPFCLYAIDKKASGRV